MEFKPEDFNGPDDVKTLEVNFQSGPEVEYSRYPQNPDDQWVYDPEVVPEGWLVKKYTFNSSHSKKVQISCFRKIITCLGKNCSNIFNPIHCSRKSPQLRFGPHEDQTAEMILILVEIGSWRDRNMKIWPKL